MDPTRNGPWVAKRRARDEFARRGERERNTNLRPDCIETLLNAGSIVALLVALYYWGAFARFGLAP